MINYQSRKDLYLCIYNICWLLHIISDNLLLSSGWRLKMNNIYFYWLPRKENNQLSKAPMWKACNYLFECVNEKNQCIKVDFIFSELKLCSPQFLKKKNYFFSLPKNNLCMSFQDLVIIVLIHYIFYNMEN